MDDPHGPTRIMPPDPMPQRQRQGTGSPDDFRLRDVQRAAGAEYDVLGEICEIGEGVHAGTAYLAQRRSSMQLEVLRLVQDGSSIDVLGVIGEGTANTEDVCPNCAAPIRAGVRFCGNCRANLTTLQMSTIPNSLSVAEWLEAKVEAERHQFQVLGRVDDAAAATGRGQQTGIVALVARAANTVKITTLILERASGGNPAVLGPDQATMLPTLIVSLVERRAEERRRAAPPIVAPAPVATVPPGLPLWAKAAILATSGAALIAAVAWTVSLFSNKRAEPNLQVAADSILTDSIRPDSIPRENDRANVKQTAVGVDWGTLQILSGPRGSMAITVDRKPETRSMIRVAPGRHILSASARGFNRATDTLVVRPGERLTWAPRLEPLPQPPRVEEHPVAPKRAVVDNTCVDASSREDWATARTACEKLASAASGNGVAERTLGNIYERGLGLSRDLSAAATWYAKSASHDDAGGQYRYGLLLRDGKGVGRDEAKAFELFKLSASRGVTEAEFAAGDALDRGAGVGRNRTEAARWYQKAADAGNADAQFALGNLYTKGDGVPKSEPEAIKWYQKAAAQGHAKARRELSWRGIKS